MGGWGSGRPGWRSTVEESRVLDINRWVRQGWFEPGVWRSGSLVWRYPDEEEILASIGYQVDTTSLHDPHVRLHYTITDPFTDEKHSLDYEVRLTTTRPHLGGIRWWFVCPRRRHGAPCACRVAKLYLPPGGRYFGCRTCYNLTYTSCRESHQFDRIFAMMAEGLPGATPLMVKHAFRQKLLRRS